MDVTGAQRARIRAICQRFVPLQVTLLLCGCPQRLDDDFKRIASEGDPPSPLVTPDVATPDEPNPDVGAPNTPDTVSDAGEPPLGAGGAPAQTPDAGPRPTVVSSVPADGTLGVLPDAALLLTFSATMDRASVEAAYTSSELPVSEVSFSWSDADRVLRIQPNAALQANAGSDAALVAAASYALEIGAGAHDTAGNTLVPRRITFSTARAITQRLGPVTNRDLTGNWRSDSTYGLADCERIDTTICMGDSPATGEPSYRGFITFDLQQAPANLIEITAAELSCSIALVYGTPFTSLGALHVDHVAFDVIGDAAYSLAAFPERQSHTTPMNIGDVLAVDALAAVRSDWGVRDYDQYRLAFESGTDTDGAPDQLGCDWSTVALALTYWLP